MKKIIIAAAIVCVAAISHAATVSWSATANALYNSVATATSYTAYLVDVTDTSYSSAAAVAAALKFGEFDGNIIYQASSGSGLSVVGSTTKTVKINVSNKNTTDTFSQAQNVSYYAILFNNGDATKATYYLAETPTAVSAQFSDAASLSATLGPQTGKTWQKIEDVPEPTSAMLLLLGMAGLALKRKRA